MLLAPTELLSPRLARESWTGVLSGLATGWRGRDDHGFRVVARVGFRLRGQHFPRRHRALSSRSSSVAPTASSPAQRRVSLTGWEMRPCARHGGRR